MLVKSIKKSTMTRTISTEIELKTSTGDCDRSPNIQYSLGEMILTYGFESNETISRATLIFKGALAIRFIPDLCVCEYMIEAYSKVCRYVNSDWLVELSAEAESHASKFPPDRKHFFVYFDHYGCVEVIAEGIQLGAGLQ